MIFVIDSWMHPLPPFFFFNRNKHSIENINVPCAYVDSVRTMKMHQYLILQILHVCTVLGTKTALILHNDTT